MSEVSVIELVIPSRDHDLGELHVRRVLPYAPHRMVGPFVFFDHMGPAEFAPGQGMSVRPHPHINLATVTYLFEGCIQHRDSLGSDLLILPGAVNWMTAGRGIVHSERTPEHLRESGGRMHGIQLWVAVPEDQEEGDPGFSHHPKDTLPEFKQGDAWVKLLLGQALGHSSPVPVASDMFYFELKFPVGSVFSMPADPREKAIYVVQGEVTLEGQAIEPLTMVVLKPGMEFEIQATKDSRLMVLGGTSVGPRHLLWNFVSSSKDRLQEARLDWSAGGPRAESPRFHPIPGDDQEYIPLPPKP